MTCKWKVFCKQGDTCVAHEGYDIWRCTGFKDKGVPMTNEEYLKSCTTKQLADVLFKIWENGYNSTIDRSKPFNFLFGEEWLNEEHKNGRN